METNYFNSLNYYSELSKLENEILKKTISFDREAVNIFMANLNCLYGMMSCRQGLQSDIFPINSPERAVRFFVYIQSMGSFQFASTIFKQLMIGQYSEAEALVRSIIELVAYGEYYSLNPDISFRSVKNIKSIPYRRTVFRFLAKYGSYPPGGPKDLFVQYNNAAHAHIGNVLEHSAKTEEGKPSISRIWLRCYNQDSFNSISHDLFIPLIGIQEVYRRVFFPDKQMLKNESWLPYWEIGHDRSVLSRLFPTMKFGK